MDPSAARAQLLLRAVAWLFSLALVAMASNKHGHDGAHVFDNYPEYNYCLGISIIVVLYTTAQVMRNVYRLS
uniref:CASP-like protein n=1 Tax=Oryza nivara TaxID=4536 RepID=A0A0E0I778_ORYNI